MKYLIAACFLFAACDSPTTETRMDRVENELDTIGQQAGPVLDSVGEKLERAGEKLKDEFDTLKRDAKPVLDSVEEKLERAGEKAEQAAKKLDKKVKVRVNKE
jgi:ElaB/YqjD/DUF883 family membrane-anchored ribosome-binding protein